MEGRNEGGRKGVVDRIGQIIFSRPRSVIFLILGVSLLFALFIPGMQLASDLDELLPREHPYIVLHEEVQDTFGGANVLTIALEVDEGDIFTNDVLQRINRITNSVHELPGVNHSLVSSLAHRTVRWMWVDEFGTLQQERFYDSNRGELTEEELELIAFRAQADPSVYGRLVSPDLKMALITAHMHTAQSDVMREVFDGVKDIIATESRPGLTIHAVGSPMLIGWVYTYFGEILQVLLSTIALVTVLLVLYFRRLYGIVLPLAGIAISSAWGLGFLNMVGISLDPVSMPIVFLLAARATSHGVQIVDRFYYELSRRRDHKSASKATFDALIRPGALAIITDVIGILAIAMASAPYHLTLATYAGFWGFTILITVNLMLPITLAVLPEPKNLSNKREKLTARVRAVVGRMANRNTARVVLAAGAVVAVGSLYFVKDLQFGDTEAGSPLLKEDHQYNISANRISSSMPGTESFFVIARAAQNGNGSLSDGLKDPDALRAMDTFTRQMQDSAVVQGARNLPQLVKHVSRLLYDGDPRWAQIPDEADVAGGIMHAYALSAPIPDALKAYTDSEFRIANMAFFLPDIRAATIEEVVDRARNAATIADEVEGLDFELAAGRVGVNAAINQSNLRDTLVVTVFVLLAIFALVSWNYRSIHAGLMMLSSMIVAMCISYGFMGANNIGMHVNIIPVVAVGIGVGIDYAIYMLDRIRSEFRAGAALHEAVVHAVSTTGVAVLFTAITLIGGVVLWVFAELRFQAEAALLLVVMLSVFAIGALVLVPAWVLALRPRFIVD